MVYYLQHNKKIVDKKLLLLLLEKKRPLTLLNLYINLFVRSKCQFKVEFDYTVLCSNCSKKQKQAEIYAGFVITTNTLFLYLRTFKDVSSYATYEAEAN